MIDGPIGIWCPGCCARVDPSGGTCSDCGGVVLTASHPSDCNGRWTDDVSGGVAVAIPEGASKAPAVQDDPLVRVCVGCKEEKKIEQRTDSSKPRSRCSDCLKSYFAEWRKKNWQRTKARNTWKGMIARCHDPKHGVGSPPGVPRYSEYGAKGVRVAKRWRSAKGFENFVADVGLPPSKDSTLDRINFKRNYTPSNCRWVDKKTQQNNKRCTHWVEGPDPETGETIRLSLTDWERKVGIHRDTIRKRLKRGWPSDVAVSLAPLLSGQRLQPEEVPF